MFKLFKKRNKYIFTNEDREKAEEIRNLNKKLKDVKKELQYLEEKKPSKEKQDSKQDLLILGLITAFLLNQNKQDSKDKTDKQPQYKTLDKTSLLS